MDRDPRRVFEPPPRDVCTISNVRGVPPLHDSATPMKRLFSGNVHRRESVIRKPTAGTVDGVQPESEAALNNLNPAGPAGAIEPHANRWILTSLSRYVTRLLYS